MADNAGDRKDIRRREKQAKIDDAQHAAVTREIMSTAQGRTWMWTQLSRCHVFDTTFTGEALTSAFNEGERNIGQQLLNEITSTCPDQFIQAMREAHERSTLSERRSGPQSDGRDSGREAGGGADQDRSWDHDPYGDRDEGGDTAVH